MNAFSSKVFAGKRFAVAGLGRAGRAEGIRGRHHGPARPWPPLRGRDDQSTNSLATSVALWPPKPKELLRITRTLRSRALCGT